MKPVFADTFFFFAILNRAGRTRTFAFVNPSSLT